jgi:hypothetical protein
MSGTHPLPPQIPVTDAMRAEIRGAIAEIDREQMSIIGRLTPQQRCEQMMSLTRMVREIAIQQLRQHEPELSEAEAQHRILEAYFQREEAYRKNLR